MKIKTTGFWLACSPESLKVLLRLTKANYFDSWWANNYKRVKDLPITILVSKIDSQMSDSWADYARVESRRASKTCRLSDVSSLQSVCVFYAGVTPHTEVFYSSVLMPKLVFSTFQAFCVADILFAAPVVTLSKEDALLCVKGLLCTKGKIKVGTNPEKIWNICTTYITKPNYKIVSISTSEWKSITRSF